MIKQLLGRLPRKQSKSVESKEAGGNGTAPFANSLKNPKNKDLVGNSGGATTPTPPANEVLLTREIGAFLEPNGAGKATSAYQSAKKGNDDLIGAVYQVLPSFKDVPVIERQNLLMKKLNICCMVFDFSDPAKSAKEKDIKRLTLLELVDYIASPNGKITEPVMQGITKMVAANFFRTLPSSSHDNKTTEPLETEEEEPLMDPAWSHLQIVYEFFLRFVTSPEMDAKLAKRYIDHAFVLRMLDLFDSEDPREREYLKTILHRIYGKFMVHRPFIRKAINNIFYRFIFETQKHNGVAEFLEILGSIINGFALPLKEEHKLFLMRVLIPLHKPKCLSTYHQQLSYCITQFIEKDCKLADTVIRGLLKCWPITSSSKEVMFLGELEEVLETTQEPEFQRCMVPLFRQIAHCLNSLHFQVYLRVLRSSNYAHPVIVAMHFGSSICGREHIIDKLFQFRRQLQTNCFNLDDDYIQNKVAERALFLWNNDHIVNMIKQNRTVILPLILPPLEKNSRNHWNQAVQSLTLNVRKIFLDLDPELFEECLLKFQAGEAQEKEVQDKRDAVWKRLEEVAASKTSNNVAVLIPRFLSFHTTSFNQRPTAPH